MRVCARAHCQIYICVCRFIRRNTYTRAKVTHSGGQCRKKGSKTVHTRVCCLWSGRGGYWFCMSICLCTSVAHVYKSSIAIIHVCHAIWNRGHTCIHIPNTNCTLILVRVAWKRTNYHWIDGRTVYVTARCIIMQRHVCNAQCNLWMSIFTETIFDPYGKQKIN